MKGNIKQTHMKFTQKYVSQNKDFRGPKERCHNIDNKSVVKIRAQIRKAPPRQ